MSTKFEQLLDYLVNEEQDKANELFHEIVVEKSREIYENLIAEEEKEDDDMEEATDADADESVEEETETDDEMDESYEEEAVESIMGEEGDEEEFPVQDKTDDAEDDFGAELGDEEDEEDGEEPATKDDIQDLEDALDELKAEFEALMAAEKHEEEEEPGVHGEPSPLDDMGGMDADKDEAESMMSLESTDDEEEMEKDVQESRVVKTQGERMREYIEKISVTMTDGEGVGSGRGDKAGQTGHDSGKSPISSGSGKPQSGANANNLAQAGKGSNEDGTSPKGKVGGLVKTGGDFVKAGTKNVASSANTKKPDGSKLTGVSKPASGEGKPVGAGTGQNNVSGATNTKSIVDKKIG
jgi:hypothetical protein